MVGTLNQFWKNLYATIPHLSMNDVVNHNTGLYHDQSLFNLIQIVNPLSAKLRVRYETLFFFRKVNMFGKKKSQDDKIGFFSQKNLRMTKNLFAKILVVFAPRLELGTSRVWGERHNQLDHANCQPPTRIELVTFSLRRRCSANWAIEALFVELCLLQTQKKILSHQKKKCCTLRKKLLLTQKKIVAHLKKKKLTN